MAETETSVANKPVWIDLSSSDPAASREFYSKLFGWGIEVAADPQYGGYAMAKVGGKDAAGIGPKQSEEQPTAWSLYIGTPDAEELARKVQSAGGTVIAPPFDVGGQGRMAVFQDPSGAFISAWQPLGMSGFPTGAPNTFGWAELNSRGIDKAIPFYREVFGWTDKQSEMGEGQPPYTEFQLGGESILGGMEMNPMVPAEVPSYWTVYITVDDVDSAFKQATDLGGREIVAPQDFPGGRFAILSDPQGAAFGVLKMQAR
ncbi:MAG: glyoxalase [Candidatus Nephthysia bennettiae]|nr:VOC family protein [Candidatus Dormibacteraeota bacterium]PZR88818.1 MAG: glyoxalase [Candidatus Dormibacteraeota bacterium]